MSEWMPIDTALTTLKLYSTYSDPIRKYDCRWTNDVLLCDRNKDIRVGYWLASKRISGWQVYGSKNYEPIAWMPLPEPYKAESEGKV